LRLEPPPNRGERLGPIALSFDDTLALIFPTHRFFAARVRLHFPCGYASYDVDQIVARIAPHALPELDEQNRLPILW